MERARPSIHLNPNYFLIVHLQIVIKKVMYQLYFPKRARETGGNAEGDTSAKKCAKTNGQYANMRKLLSSLLYKCNMSPKNLCGPESLKPSCSQSTEKFAEMAPARVNRNVAQTVNKPKASFFPPFPARETSKERGKAALNSPFASEGQEKCRNVR